MTINDENKTSHFIPCDCREGGLMIQGIEIDLEPPVPLVYFLIVHAGDRMPSLWERIKNAFKLLRKGRIYTEEVILNGSGVNQLWDAVEDIMDKWPEQFVRKLEDNNQ